MKKEIKGFIIGILVSSLLINPAVLAAGATKSIDVMLNSIKIKVNGEPVNSDNILYNGTTYVPLRAVSEMLGKDVTWDGSTNTAGINDIGVKDDSIEIIAENPNKSLKNTEEVAESVDSIVLIESYDNDNNIISSGSGVFINNEGYIITNYHVIESNYKLNVITNEVENGKKYNAVEIINYDTDLDLALLKINTTSKGLYISSEKPKLGSSVVAIGNPLGFLNTVSEGIVSGNREIENTKYIQTSAPISPGSSGGALLNMYGEVIGIITAKVIDGENMNLAIPGDVVLDFIENSADSKRNINTIKYDNNTYVGEVNNGLEHGYGRTVWNNGDVYEGSFVNGERTGFGLYYWENGDIYLGDFVYGELHGEGTYYYNDGDIYAGKWVFGEQTGLGQYLYSSNNSLYVGDFVNGKLEGYGALYYLDGSVLFGKFENDDIVGEYSYFDANGKVSVFEYINGNPKFIK